MMKWDFSYIEVALDSIYVISESFRIPEQQQRETLTCGI